MIGKEKVYKINPTPEELVEVFGGEIREKGNEKFWVLGTDVKEHADYSYRFSSNFDGNNILPTINRTPK